MEVACAARCVVSGEVACAARPCSAHHLVLLSAAFKRLRLFGFQPMSAWYFERCILSIHSTDGMDPRVPCCRGGTANISPGQWLRCTAFGGRIEREVSERTKKLPAILNFSLRAASSFSANIRSRLPHWFKGIAGRLRWSSVFVCWQQKQLT